MALSGAFLVGILAGCSSDSTDPSSGSTTAENDPAAGTMNGSGTGSGNGTGTGSGTGTGTGTGTGGDSGAGGADAAVGVDAAKAGNAGALGFMDVCTQVGDPGDCAAGLQCHNFSDHGMHCTHACTTAQDCPAPSSGCGGIKLCKP